MSCIESHSRLLSPGELYPRLGNALVSAETLPEFSYEGPNKFGDMFYALLRSNSSHETIRSELHDLSLSGSFAGIGFATSIYCVIKFFSDDFRLAFFCEREPYVYLAGKVVLRLIDGVSSGPELMLSLVDYHSFYAAYRQVVAAEPDSSPIFIRESRAALLEEIPDAVQQLRRGIFTTHYNKLSPRERDLFAKDCESSIERMLDWIEHIVDFKSYYLLETLYRNFTAIQRKLRNRVIPLCVDMFHPDLWDFFAAQPELWSEPGMFHFSNAAVYSQNAEIRKAEFSVSCDYGPELPSRIPGAAESRHYFLYTIRHQRYEDVWTREIPTLDNLLDTFRPKKKKRTGLQSTIVDVSTEGAKSSELHKADYAGSEAPQPPTVVPKEKVAPEPPAQKTPFRLGTRGRPPIAGISSGRKSAPKRGLNLKDSKPKNNGKNGKASKK